MGDVATGIPGYDYLLNGGFREGSLNLVSGSSGTGKTLLCVDFLLNGAELYGQKGLFITLEESKENIVKSLSQEKRALLKKNSKRIFFIDLSLLRTLFNGGGGEREGGDSLGADTLAGIADEWIAQKGVTRVVIDGIATLGIRYGCENEFRGVMQGLYSTLRSAGVTCLITTEVSDPSRISRFNVEEYLSDSITVMSYSNGQRNIEILKVRGQGFVPGGHSFAISDSGIEVFPSPEMEIVDLASSGRISSGIDGLDAMTKGGYLEGDVTILAGSAGTGKTIFCIQFLVEGLRAGERCLYVTHEENESQLIRDALNIGLDLRKYMDKGLLSILSVQIGTLEPNRHAMRLKENLKGVKRLVKDPITDYYQVLSPADARAYLSKLASTFKKNGITTLMTAETPELIGGTTITGSGISFLADNVIVLRYVELGSEMKKALNILKMRGSDHDKDIREYIIDKNGIKVLEKFEGVEGVLGGVLVRRMAQRVEKFFD